MVQCNSEGPEDGSHCVRIVTMVKEGSGWMSVTDIQASITVGSVLDG